MVYVGQLEERDRKPISYSRTCEDFAVVSVCVLKTEQQQNVRTIVMNLGIHKLRKIK
jgi:hypothetical protein